MVRSGLFQPVARQKLYHDVVSQLLGHIRGGRFAPGSDLPSERELVQLLGVGRVAVREALHSLQERGVIAIRHGRRAQVLEPSSALLAPRLAEAAEHVLASFGGAEASPRDDVLEARILFESAMARLAAERATDADIARLRSALEANRATVARISSISIPTSRSTASSRRCPATPSSSRSARGCSAGCGAFEAIWSGSRVRIASATASTR